MVDSTLPHYCMRHCPHYSNLNLIHRSSLPSFFSSSYLSLKSLIPFPSPHILTTCISTPSSLAIASKRHPGTLGHFNPRHFTITQQSSVTTPPYLTTTFFLLDYPFIRYTMPLRDFPNPVAHINELFIFTTLTPKQVEAESRAAYRHPDSGLPCTLFSCELYLTFIRVRAHFQWMTK